MASHPSPSPPPSSLSIPPSTVVPSIWSNLSTQRRSPLQTIPTSATNQLTHTNNNNRHKSQINTNASNAPIPLPPTNGGVTSSQSTTNVKFASRLPPPLPVLPSFTNTLSFNSAEPYAVDPSVDTEPELVHVSKWQRLEPTSLSSSDSAGVIGDSTLASAYGSIHKQAIADPVEPSSHGLSVPSNNGAAEYFAAMRACTLASKFDDGRASLIPDIPGVEIEAYMAPRAKTAFDMLKDKQACLSLGDEYLDEVVGGGLVEGITELVGEAGCGKTQMAMHLLLQCQLPRCEGGLGGGALFLSIEGDFPVNRLRSLAETFKIKHSSITQSPLDHIYIKAVKTPEDLWNVLYGSLRISLESGDVKLIVIDSIAAMFRTEQNVNVKNQNLNERSQDVLRLAGQLKQYSSTYHVPVVVINQVADFFTGMEGNELRIEEAKHSYLHHWSMMSSGRRVVPALGLTWANCVNTRIFLTRKHEFVPAPYISPPPPSIDTRGLTPLVNMFTPPGAASQYQSQRMSFTQAQTQPLSQQQYLSQQQHQQTPDASTRMRRYIHLVFSPTAAPRSGEFMIETTGIRGISTLPDIVLTPPSSQPSSTISSNLSLSSYPSTQAVTRTTYLKNMFTPSGNSHQLTSSNSTGSVGSSGSDNSHSTSSTYFDDGDALSDEDLAALAQVEATMVARQRVQANPNDHHQPSILQPIDVINSPNMNGAQQQQQSQSPFVPMKSPMMQKSPMIHSTPPAPAQSPIVPNIWQRQPRTSPTIATQ